MKKPHKPKARKPVAKQSRTQGASAQLVAHSTRRAPYSRPEPVRSRRTHPGPATVFRRTSPVAITSTADKRAFRLLLAPFALMALVLAVLPALHVYPTLRDLIAATPSIDVPQVKTITEARAAPAPKVRGAVANTERAQTPLATTTNLAALAAGPELSTAQPTTFPVLAEQTDNYLPATRARLAAPATLRQTAPQRSTAPRIAAELLSEPREEWTQARLASAEATRVVQGPIAELTVGTPVLGAVMSRDSEPQVAMMQPLPAPRALIPVPAVPDESACPVVYGSAAPSENSANPAGATSEPFGNRLALAAAAQAQHFVIYDDKYRQISRAGGDVPSLYGVCTDVVIRAYRSVGVDLQVLVQASRVGAGDPNIDHRRTETLRRYLARFGRDLPVTPFGEDYEPGDIVTYWRPQNSGSRSHIAIVAAERGPSGNPMIIHNRGWGPQLEDGLFVDRITGHYRYDGSVRPTLPPQLATTRARPFPPVASATPVTLSAPAEQGVESPGAF